MNAIVAVYSDWGIGTNGTQPVVLSADRKHFVEITRGAAVIVGRKTLEDFPGGRPLKGRFNILLTRRDMEMDGVRVVHTPEEAVLEASKHEKVFVLGGASVFSQLLPYTDRIYVTKIGIAPPSDSYFPDLDSDAEWCCADRGEQLEENGIPYSFCTYERVKRGGPPEA